jgi:hypothetical protein
MKKTGDSSHHSAVPSTREASDEVQALTAEEKFRQLEMLVASAPLVARTAAEEEEVQRVREIWIRLYQRYGLLPSSG